MNKAILLAERGETEAFYLSPEWKGVREKVLQLDHRECQICRRKGKYRKGQIVHHVKHLKDRPDLALSIRDPATGERQLETVCRKCHMDLHPENQRQFTPAAPPLTVERWD